jgi:ferredoxin
VIPQVLDRADFDSLFEQLKHTGHTVVGPTVRENAIVYDELDSSADLPEGLTDDQDAGKYRLVRRDDQALFGYAVGPHSWKKYLFPPRTTLWSAEVVDGSLRFAPQSPASPRYAFLGMRACELAAVAIQDRVFMGGDHTDPTYSDTRQTVFSIAINCAVAGGTCFCTSMGTGPRCESGYDLVMTEIVGDDHRFVMEAGSDAGVSLLEALPVREATAADLDLVEQIVTRTAASMGRAFDNTGVKELLAESVEHPRWDEIANRCLACANCTLVCPTCFCSTTEDMTDLNIGRATRTRRWDSCFTLDYSTLHGQPIRGSTSAMYRQWLTHKLSSWYDQFGTSGCVGCGRCITWCPVGIDITTEVAAMRSKEGALA